MVMRNSSWRWGVAGSCVWRSQWREAEWFSPQR
jgi:hypothetical protein